MTRKRILAIGLDGYEQSLGDRFMAAGDLPSLAMLRSQSARFLLDHGAATRTGLAWEHLSSGRSPGGGGRASAVNFDTQTYDVWHDGTSLVPFVAHLDARTVVFDPPYFDLRLAPSVRGVTNWGAHDPGVAYGARPVELMEELLSRFGRYPAHDCMYEIVWPSVERTRQLGDALVHSTEIRARAARWLLGEACADWDLAIVVAGELHSSVEAFWHGVDPAHPLHSSLTAEHAAEKLRAVYRATDTLLGDLLAVFPDANVIAFAMNGMGPNRSDVASMALLSELLYRHAFRRRLLRVPGAWSRAAGGLPMLGGDEDWSQAVYSRISPLPEPLDLARRVAARVLPESVKRLVRPDGRGPSTSPAGAVRFPLDWMPTSRYQPYWPSMPFFALPSFYDGRIRINLEGREREGMISPAKYESACDQAEALVRGCRDLTTGEPVVEHVDRCAEGNPFALGPLDSDLVIVWRRAALGFEHPDVGRIGPLPYRRTGGHTGPYGMAYIADERVDPGDYGVRSSFDVVPTIVELLGEQVPPGVSGRSLLDAQRDRRSATSV